MEAAFVKADWIVLPYNSATQSGVVIDGYRYGRPSIAFNVGAIAEQIEDGVSGYLIPKTQKIEFAKKLKDVVKMNQDEYKKLSRAAYEYGIKKYSAEGAVDRFLQVILF